MRGHTRILAGTALATLMATAGAIADTRPDMSHEPVLLLAQAEGEQPVEGQQPKIKKQRAREQQVEESTPEPEQPKAEKRRKQQAEQQPPAEAQPAAEPEQPRAEKRRKQQAEQQAPAEAQPAAEPEQPRAEKRRKQQAEQQAPAEAQPAAESEQPRAEKRRKQAEQAPAESEPAEPAPAEQAAEPEQPKAEKRKKQRAEQQAPAESESTEPAPAEQAGEPEQPKAEKRRKQRAEQQPPAGEAPVQSEAPDDGGTAPVLDSQKRPPAPPAEAQTGTGEGQQTAKPAAPPAAPAGPLPADDKAAQEAVQPAKIQPVTAEQGKRRERRRDDDEPRRRERPKGSEVVREIGDRLIIEFNNQVIVESNDRPRMSRGARDVYYEDLPRGRTRETIVRRDGTRVVTVRNAYGDVIRRSRIAPDDREYVLVYVEEDNYDRVRDWRDPGLDLPPLRLEIPEDEYILDAATAAEEPEAYYTFLEQPPVERVERLYSVDEVKRSARIRDKTRRVDLDTLTFEFGSASIPEDQIAKLDGVAQAMEKLLEKNPAETFLIEGHTDAVGSDLANLALSDRRAEAVADALSTVFAIPPENLATQGYGEQYLKVRTQAPERENRRVAIRRITPLVAPVTSAK